MRRIMSVKYWIDRGIMDAGFVEAKTAFIHACPTFLFFRTIIAIFHPFLRFRYKKLPRIFLRDYYFLLKRYLFFFFVIDSLVKCLTVRNNFFFKFVFDL